MEGRQLQTADLERGGERGSITTAGDAVVSLTRRFEEAGLETPALDARLLVAEALAETPDRLRTERGLKVDAAACARIATFARRRAVRREPVSRILGRREFWSLTFDITPDTLDPRPDSETVVATALGCVPDRSAALEILDLGTGSGCLLLAALSDLPNATGTGADRSAPALDVARRNADRLGLAARVHFVQSDWADRAGQPFDLILCNPPYIPSADIAGLAPEVRDHDPAPALDGGPDGLDAYRALAPLLPGLLTADGAACFEIGAGQSPSATQIFRESGLSIVRIEKDLAGIERCLVLQKNHAKSGLT